MTALLKAALYWADAGCTVIPAKTDGSKMPFGQWKRYMKAAPTAADQEQWFGDGQYDGLGVVCGPVSGNLEMFELEGRAVAEGVDAALADLMRANGFDDLWQQIDSGYKERTPSGGMHWLFRVEGEPRGNLKLARRPSTGDELADNPDEPLKVLIETRGAGGFTIVAPSGGRTHPGRGSWERVAGSPTTIPTITEDDRDALYAIAAMLDAVPVHDAPPPRGPQRERPAGDLRPGDDFNDRADWADILTPHGWGEGHRLGTTRTWVRPGKDVRQGISATTGRNDGDNLFVFSSSTLFDTEKPYSKFAAYTLLNHDGDWSAAARDLNAKGYGTQRAALTLVRTATSGNNALALEAAPLVAPDADWEPPQPLASGSLPTFPTWALGELQTYVEHVADVTQTPVDLAGMLTLAILSAAVGKGARVHVHEQWSEQLSLYVAVALPAGEGKSPVFKRLMAPLRELEQEQTAAMLPDIVDAAQRRRVMESRIKTLEATAAKKYGAEGDEAYADAQALNLQLAEQTTPTAPRLFVDDVTSEALVAVLAEQGGQVALLSEEGGIFGTLAGRYSSGQPNLDAVLKAHDGGTIRVDRKTSEPLFVENPALTIGLAVQPSVLRSLAGEEALRGRGLIARFLYAVPESRVGSRDQRRRMAPTSTEPPSVHFVDVVSGLYRARCILCKVSLEEDSLSLLTTFCEELERRRHPESGDLRSVLDWSAKLDGATIRIAGLLALADASTKCTEAGSVDVGVSVDVMERAIAIARYLIPHTQAALDLMDPSVVDTDPAAQLLAWTRQQALTEVSIRDAHVALRGRNTFKKVDAVISAVVVLQQYGYLRRLPDPPDHKGRPPSPRYALNPLEPTGDAR